MDKFIFADAKRLKKNYMMPFIALSIPFWQLTLVVIAVINININKINQVGYYMLTSGALILGLGGLAVIYTAGFLVVHYYAGSHIKHSYIEITPRELIVSRFSQKTWQKFKPVYHKRLYVINYNDLESIRIEKGNIIIKGKIRAYYDKAERLTYSVSAGGIAFDKWWYDYNPLSEHDSLVVKDIFLNTAKAIRLIKKASSFERERLSRFNRYKAKVLEKLPSASAKKKSPPKSAM